MITVATKPKTFIGAGYTPSDSYYDSDIQEVVDVYEIHGPLIVEGSGSLCEFVRNNALSSDPEQFGIKYAWGLSKYEMHDMFKTQDKAYEVGAAPPVHRMVKIIHHLKDARVFWGYTTGVAECKHNLIWGDFLRSEYDDYLYNFQDAKKRYLNNIIATVNAGDEEFFTEGVMEDIASSVKEHFDNIDCLELKEWCVMKGFIIADDEVIDLLRRLEDVTITKGDTEYTLGGDLHSGNLAMWQGNVVCIDFSYHALIEVY